jgi:hypothetical protein
MRRGIIPDHAAPCHARVGDHVFMFYVCDTPANELRLAVMRGPAAAAGGEQVWGGRGVVRYTLAPRTLVRRSTSAPSARELVSRTRGLT